MVNMASKKIFRAVLCPTQLFRWKLICTFNQHCLSYKISNRLQFNSSLFPHKLFKMLLHWHTFFQHVPHVENAFKLHKYLCICLLLTCLKGKLVLLLDKTVFVSQETRPKFIDSQNFYFHFHYKLFCIKAVHFSTLYAVTEYTEPFHLQGIKITIQPSTKLGFYSILIPRRGLP